ncbi:MAG: hypothetical protein R6U29_05655, partial [Desulfosudaceae bacterium]
MKKLRVIMPARLASSILADGQVVYGDGLSYGGSVLSVPANINADGLETAFLQNMMSAGRLYGGKLTDNGDGTVDVSAGEGVVKAEHASIGDTNIPTSEYDGQGSKVSRVSWNTTTVSLAQDAYNYIYYDGSTDTITATTDF